MTQRLTMLGAILTTLFGMAYFATSFAEEPKSNNWSALEVQYAEANLQLAQAQLAIAEQENAQLADSVSPETMTSLHGSVALAEGRLKSASGGGGDPYAGFIAEAEAHLSGAMEKLQDSKRANSIDADAVPDGMLRREQAEIDVAKARLAMLKVIHEQPADVRAQWELRQLQDEVRALWNRPLIRN